MIATSDGMPSGIYTYFVAQPSVDAGLALAAYTSDADSPAWRLEPGDYLDMAGGLVAATPELAALAISWSRG
ncbi:hypothetical protein CXZ10_01340 [Pleomorphomonas diazotrophica]|uniref:Uncharacterized protein n=1 Tax=Pleomorphomonas diazotrophica TaxID=1166257 RepID=A0A1I4VF84_9HYPH|nr:hypothetical protein [Pleomorphomonas diazotrophica]PKR90064.1 hypothetical protein CXZ10_01340 [Pleomorphomonas diazotrophica]SFM99835.1 hypothetical protein SAMN05192571_11179 [Pleomorphomonas diazotrophica]